LRPKKVVSECAWIFVFSRPRRVSLTMALVLFPIDVIFLDSKKKVVEIKKDFRPWQLYFPKLPCSYVIELKDGLIEKSSTHVGDQLNFDECGHEFILIYKYRNIYKCPAS
jgi:uncharacterized membrane protein (UPF0127 family)